MYHRCHYPAGDNRGCVCQRSFSGCFFMQVMNNILTPCRWTLPYKKWISCYERDKTEVVQPYYYASADSTKQSSTILLSLFERWGVTLVILKQLLSIQVRKAEPYSIWHPHCWVFKQPEEQVCRCVTKVWGYYSLLLFKFLKNFEQIASHLDIQTSPQNVWSPEWRYPCMTC